MINELLSAINDITVAFGTAVEDLELPATVSATLNDEEATEVELTVEWAETEDFNANAAGTYTFTGTVKVSEDAEYTISDEDAAVTVSVIVEAPTQAVIDAAIADVDAKASALAADLTNTDKQAALKTALESPVLNLSSIDEFFIGAYATDIDTNLTNTIARLQQAINRVNAGQEVLVKAVNDALNVGTLRTALTNLGIKNVAASTTFDLEYFDAIEANTTDTKEKIQAVIDETNLVEIEKLVAKAETSVKQADTTAAKTALTAVKAVDANFDKPAEGELKGAFEKRVDVVQTKIDVATAIAAVNEATDADELETALEDADLDLENLDMVKNKTAYFTAFGLLTDDFTTVTEIQAFVDSVNTTESDSLITSAIAAVNAATDADELETALEDAELDLENLDMVNNKTAYFTAFGLLTIPGADDFTTVPEIQAFVDAVNLAEAIDAVNGETVAADLFTALDSAVLDLESVVERNQEIYLSELTKLVAADATFEFETPEAIQEFVNAANATPVGLVNTSKNTTEARTALESTELDLDLAVYNELTSLQKNLVAQKLRADGSKFKTAAEIQAELDTAVLTLI